MQEESSSIDRKMEALCLETSEESFFQCEKRGEESSEENCLKIGEENSLVNEEDNELECPVCYEICRPPWIPRCEYGHLICATCKNKLKISNCPVCRSTFVPVRPLIAEAVSKLIPFPCRNDGKGCSVSLSWKELQRHELCCPYERFCCPLLSCPVEVTRSNLLKHVTASHNLGLADGRFHVTPDVFSFVSFLSHKNMIAVDETFSFWTPKLFFCKYPLFFVVFREQGSFHFWLWMGANRVETGNYRYRICIQNPASSNPDELLVTYESRPVSLETSLQEIQEERLCLILTENQVEYCQANSQQGLKYTVQLRGKPRAPNQGTVTPV